MTLCAYVKILRFEDTLRNQQYYIEAMKLAATVILNLIFFLYNYYFEFRFIYKW